MLEIFVPFFPGPRFFFIFPPLKSDGCVLVTDIRSG